MFLKGWRIRATFRERAKLEFLHLGVLRLESQQSYVERGPKF